MSENEDRIPSIKEKADCRDILRRFFPQHYREKGMSRCPFHDDKTPSLKVDRESVHCFGACSASFDALELFERGANCTKPEAIQTLAEELGLDNGDRQGHDRGEQPKADSQQVDFEKRFEYLLKHPMPQAALEYLIQTRGLSKRIVDQLVSEKRVAWSEKKQALTFPLTSRDGKRVASLQYVPLDGSPKTLASGSKQIEAFFFLENPGQIDFLVVTEAIIDGLSVLDACKDAEICSIISASNPEKLAALRGCTPIVFLDGDKPGRDAARKAMKHTGTGARFVDWSLAPGGFKDPNDLLRAGHAKMIDRMIRASRIPTREELEAAAREGPSKAGNNKGSIGPEMPPGYTAAELVKMEIPEPIMIVDRILPEGFTVLAGKPKLGKSWLALNLAVAVAVGGRALGQIQVEQGRVLYLALEDGKRRLKTRLLSVLRGAPAPNNLHVFTEWPKIDKGGLQLLHKWIKDHPDIRLVILDTLAKLWPKGSGRNSQTLYNQDYDVMTYFKSISDACNIGLVAVTHLRKAAADDPIEQISGSMGISGSADTMLILSRARGKADATLLCTGRDVEECELALQFDKTITSWCLLGDAQDYKRSQEQVEVLELLRGADDPMQLQDIIDILDKKRRTVAKLLAKLERDGLIVKPSKGKYALSQKTLLSSGSYGSHGSSSDDRNRSSDDRNRLDDAPVPMKNEAPCGSIGDRNHRSHRNKKEDLPPNLQGEEPISSTKEPEENDSRPVPMVPITPDAEVI